MASLVVPRKVPAAGRRDTAAAWRHLDVGLVIMVITIAGLGALMVYSATRRAFETTGGAALAHRQIAFVVLGVVVMAAVTLVDYRRFRDFAPAMYLAVVVALLLVLVVGAERKGAQAWFPIGPFQLQPSEFAKFVLIVCIAAYCSMFEGAMSARKIAVIMAVAMIPLGLIYLQPDLGTALVFAGIIMGMLLVGGARPRHLLILAGMGISAVIVVLQLGVLEQYQLDRLSAFLDPENDTQRSAYNLDQSKTAIGAGGFDGKGLFQGTQTNLSYVPEQHTDFIFTVVGEELGFRGSATLLALFALAVWRTWRAAMLSRDFFGTMLCVGVLSMLVFQLFQNVGMTMGIMPITGIPLPFMSYGGSSTIASFASMGLVLNVYMRRFS